MLASLLLTFREGLEAALVVGIILGTLNQTGHRDRRAWVWAAVGVAAALSVGLALALQAAGARFEGTAEQVFEGFAMLLAVLVLTYMIFWMRHQARHIKSDLEREVGQAVRYRHNWALFGLAFLAVFREGIETALFLTAASLVSSQLATFTGGLIGLAAAIIAGWLIYRGTARLPVRHFFNVTSVLLLVFAAGLFAHALHEFQEAGWLPVFVEHVWDLKPVLDDESTGGAVLRVLVGYNDDPSALEIVGYLGYWLATLGAVNWWVNRRPVRRPSLASQGGVSPKRTIPPRAKLH